MKQAIARKAKPRKVPGVLAGSPIDFNPRVQGIDSSLDDVKLYGRAWRAEVGDGLREANLERAIEGASTLKLVIHDPARRLLQHPMLQSAFDVEIDDLWFRFVKAEKQDSKTLGLTFEDREIARLRRHKGARKAFRDQVTRAEFALRLLREEKPAIPFYSPQLHKRQPIESATQGRQNQEGKLVRRDMGLSGGAGLAVKGVQADAGQIRIIDRVLDVCLSMSANRRVMVATVMCIVQENEARGGNTFQQNADWPGSPNDLENATRNFLSRAPTYPGGALKYERQHPGGDLGQMVQTIQRSAYPGAYSRWEAEATRTVAQYLGGSKDNPTGSVEPAGKAGERYAFERKKKEDTWACQRRLAEEVGWRCFISAGIEYFVAEPDLLRSKLRAEVYDGAPGVEDLTFDWDSGKPITEVRLRVRAKAWSAPPGSVVEVSRNGPADGRYIVSKIAAGLGRSLSAADITLKRPTAGLPEPASNSKRGGKAGGRRLTTTGSTSSDIQRIVAEIDRIEKLHMSYVWGGSHGQSPTPRNGPFDCSSFVSHLIQLVDPNAPTMTTVTLAGYGRSGPGREFTIFNKNGGPGGGHTFVGVKVGGTWRYAGTSSSNPGGGPGWFDASAAYRGGFQQRHVGNL